MNPNEYLASSTAVNHRRAVKMPLQMELPQSEVQQSCLKYIRFGLGDFEHKILIILTYIVKFLLFLVIYHLLHMIQLDR